MRMIDQRELQNQSSQILREAEKGEQFLITTPTAISFARAIPTSCPMAIPSSVCPPAAEIEGVQHGSRRSRE
jgi:antitoxin (DNA-binding transcriptional repressor) of toxin-antitoxin stability system